MDDMDRLFSTITVLRHAVCVYAFFFRRFRRAAILARVT